MFLHPLAIKAIEQKAKAEKLLKECHCEVVLLREKIREFKKIADEKICEETRKHSLYGTLSDVRMQIHTIEKTIESTYSHWFYVCNDSCEGWDCDYYDDKIAEFVKPVRELLDATQMKCLNLEEQIVAPIRKKYYVDIDALTNKLIALEEKEKELKALIKECYETMCLALKPVLDVYLPIFEFIFKTMGDSEPKKTPTIVPQFVDGNWRISFEFDEGFEYTGKIDEDEFDDEASEIRNGLIGQIELFEDKFNSLCEELVPGLVEALVEYDDSDIEIDGRTYYHKGYYEDDTGYGEPSGDFYYGDVTASTGVSITVIIE